jgi:hypothetical protein
VCRPSHVAGEVYLVEQEMDVADFLQGTLCRSGRSNEIRVVVSQGKRRRDCLRGQFNFRLLFKSPDPIYMSRLGSNRASD